MSEYVRVRLMLARMDTDTEPSVCGAVDETIWEHWDDQDEAKWQKSCRDLWGDLRDTTFREVVAVFPPDDLVVAFEAPEVRGHVVAAGTGETDE